MGAAADVQALAQELDIERGLLYGWRRIYIRGGAEALRNSGRPRVVQMHPSEASAASKVGPVWAAIPISTASAEETPGCPAMVPPASASCAAHDGGGCGTPDCGSRAEDRPAAAGTGFFSRSLAACQGVAPVDRRTWRDGIYAVIHAQMQQQGESLGIERSCELVKVSRAGYYRHWLASKPKQEETALRDEIQRLSLAKRYQGYRLITHELRQLGWTVNHKRVQRIRREDNLLCLSGRTFRPATTDGRHSWKIWPNLAWNLEAPTVNQLWVADITYVRLNEAFVYLAVVLDAFSRKVIGWSMADHLRAKLSLAALEMALSRRDITPGGLVHHSDRGVQYACGDYIERLERAGIQPSMSRPGCPWDNAMAESWMRTLKREEVDGQAYRDLAAATASIGAFIEEVYNRQRMHSALAYRAPEAYEASLPRVLGLPHAASQAPVAAAVCG
jgi:transposase InsO family protein